MSVSFCTAEQDAKEMTCPLTLGDSGPWPCVGSLCMAWRWVETHIKNPDCPDGDMIPSGDTHGYCGLAGKPWGVK
jgi:hypothetical protein